ncbi:MAG: nucleotidyl transferase AbiEii/AbiGii toxin family protein [Bacteroidales bacterium]|nr:nucleotidyl transferase AbiEii/AbiGii toxin family protein [Bacteroidales bacterium]
MIHKDTLSKEWILNFRNKPDLKKKDPALIEKMIYALYLLECLARQPIDFIFKGGTSLVLIMEEGNRFSVDVDISSKVTRQSIEKSLTNIVENSEFESFKLDEDRSYKNATIPKAHYFLFYKSNFNNTANYILLDILFQENKYPNIQQLKIESDWLKIVDPIITVATPTINSILGDKLTAFAPNTTGVPYFKNKELEIIKQLFDISLLIDRVDNIKEVYNSFTSIVNEEIRFRNLQINSDDVVADIFQTALLIAQREKNNGESLIKFNEIKVGLTKISSFTIKRNFRIDEAIAASAKAAWFATKLKNKDFSEFELYNETVDIASMQIQRTEYNYLNKLKKSNKAAFYYWYQCIETEIR